MADMTLRELCQKSGVSRRAVQGYEKIGLVSATSKNKYGYLIYDEKAQRRIQKIRMYQKIGFTLQEIQLLIDAPEEKKIVALEEQLIKLKQEEEDLKEVIIETREIIEKMKKNIKKEGDKK